MHTALHTALNLRIRPLRLSLGFCVSALCWGGLVLSAHVQAQGVQELRSSSNAMVGQVSLVIGQATVARPGVASPLAVTSGLNLQVGDRLLTSGNGHIHVRFVDGALVSLRPASTLSIKEYRYDAQSPANSEVRFELEQGVVRAISGQAAESAKDKFRLNTPLAAIGVKGTDFVVEASSAKVNAIVNQGAIVLAPFDAQCLASTLGPCSTQFAKELTAALKGMALTYSLSMPSPQLLPLGQLKGSDLLNLALPMGGISQSPSQSQTPSTGLAVASAQGAVQSAIQGAVPGNSSSASNASSTEASASNASATASNNANNANNANARVQQNQVDGQAYSNVNQILNRTVTDSSLVWGRWGGAYPQDNLTAAFKDAMQGRAVTVGDGYLFLFRQENNAANLLSVQQGNVNFTLQNSFAYFLDQGNNLNAATVNSGTLGVNFSTQDVKTTLNLSTPATVSLAGGAAGATGATNSAAGSSSAGPGVINQTLTATAKLNPSTGIFLLSPALSPVSSSAGSATPTSGANLGSPTVAGAVSLDTKQAGYLFTLPSALGSFKGGTLWGR